MRKVFVDNGTIILYSKLVVADSACYSGAAYYYGYL